MSDPGGPQRKLQVIHIIPQLPINCQVWVGVGLHHIAHHLFCSHRSQCFVNWARGMPLGVRLRGLYRHHGDLTAYTQNQHQKSNCKILILQNCRSRRLQHQRSSSHRKIWSLVEPSQVIHILSRSLCIYLLTAIRPYAQSRMDSFRRMAAPTYHPIPEPLSRSLKLRVSLRFRMFRGHESI